MKIIDAIFQGGLRLIGLAEQEVANVVKVGAFIRTLDLPPATHPGVYADLLNLIGLAPEVVQKVQSWGGTLGKWGSVIQVLQGAEAEFLAGQEVTGNVKVGSTVYDYDFKPRPQTQAGVVNAPPASAPLLG